MCRVVWRKVVDRISVRGLGVFLFRKGVGGCGGFFRGVKLWVVRGIIGVGGYVSFVFIV